ARHLANLPFAFRHIALMPDAHQGYGMPIGGVLATEGVVIPDAVGVDIGCGMCAVQTSLQAIEQDALKQIMGDVAEGKGQVGKMPCLFQGSRFQIIKPELDRFLFRTDNFLHRT
ncbi:MAG: hypothetical protein D3914_12090, partial [Candidatus Electrothrix sp. LOE2]|nr:hypothetical protein [Candidatus Electrothrix sp. LOE2]